MDNCLSYSKQETALSAGLACVNIVLISSVQKLYKDTQNKTKIIFYPFLS